MVSISYCFTAPCIPVPAFIGSHFWVWCSVCSHEGRGFTVCRLAPSLKEFWYTSGVGKVLEAKDCGIAKKGRLPEAPGGW